MEHTKKNGLNKKWDKRKKKHTQGNVRVYLYEEGRVYCTVSSDFFFESQWETVSIKSGREMRIITTSEMRIITTSEKQKCEKRVEEKRKETKRNEKKRKEKNRKYKKNCF